LNPRNKLSVIEGAYEGLDWLTKFFTVCLSQFIDSFPKFPDVFIIFPYPIFEGMDYMEQYLPEPVDG
jgi:hypothetical protein